MTGEVRRQIVGPRDRAVIAGELGRPPHDLTGIAVRCPFGYPAVIETAPVLTGGAPNPTLLYLTCPTLVNSVSRAEADGAVRELKSSSRVDARLREFLDEVTRLYRQRRTELAGGETEAIRRAARLDAGIGGPEGPEAASCLHAYAAALLAVMSGWLAGARAGAAPPAARAEGAPPDASAEETPPVARAEEVWNRLLPLVDDCWCTDRRCSRWDPGERRAAIDVGTISVRLLVADVVNGRPQTVVRRTEVTRLGEGLRPGGLLTGEARRRTAKVVARFVAEARDRGADSPLLAGTSAAREAIDGEEFIRLLGRENGVAAVVLSGRREAELAHAGASLDIPGEPMVLLDVGGGSTELICPPEGGAVETVSLELGASRATERWIKSDPPAPEEMAQAHDEAGRAFGGLNHRYDAVVGDRQATPEPAKRRLVGVAGTVTTLACLDAGLQEYDADLLHLRELSLEGVRRLLTRLSALTTEERAALPCVQAGRAPVIVGGAVVVLAAMETLGYDRMTVSERDLLDGLVLSGA